MGIMDTITTAGHGFINYLTSVKNEVKKEWDEFKEEKDKISSYDQSTTSDVLQQTSNGISFVAEVVGSLVNNKSTRELASETLEDIANSEIYKEVSEDIDEVVADVSQEVNEYLDAHPETKANLQHIGKAIDEKVDEGVHYVKEVAAEHDEALRNIGAVGTVITAIVPVAKAGKLVNAVHKAEKIDIDIHTLSFSEVRHSQATVSHNKIDRDTGQSYTYDDLEESMSQNGWQGDPIDVVRMPDEKLTSIDNTRVRSAKKTKTDIQAKIREFDEELSESEKDRFSKSSKGEYPTTWGEAITLRIQNQPAYFRKKEDGNGTHDLPRVTGRPSSPQNNTKSSTELKIDENILIENKHLESNTPVAHKIDTVQKNSNSSMLTKEAGIITAGVTTAVVADSLQKDEIDYNQYLPEHLRPNQAQQTQPQESIHPPSVQAYLDQFKPSNENTNSNTQTGTSEQSQTTQADGIDPNTGYYTNLPDSVNQYYESLGILPHQQQGNENDMGRDID